MPRRTPRRPSHQENASSSTGVSSITTLRNQCAERGLPTHGRRNALVARLQHHASGNANATSATPPSEIPPQHVERHSNATSTQFTEPQIATIESLVSRVVEQSVSAIASQAARAAVQAMANSTPTEVPVTHESAEIIPVDTTSSITPSRESASDSGQTPSPSQGTTSVAYGNGFHEVPACYIKQIQSGEFFDLSKLLPKNMSSSTHFDEPMILTLENSVIKAKKASQPSARITDIDQWTTAFTTYMSVMVHKFPGRSQELLHYMSLIRHAAHNHRGLGWCIYDHKFRCKAALNLSLDWSVIDQQLWLMIFTTSPDVLSQQYPLFSNGPHKWASSGDVRGGYCRNFNRGIACSRQPCPFKHECNNCDGKHPGTACPSLHSRENKSDDRERNSKRETKTSKSRRD